MRAQILLAGAICGTLWWLVSWCFGDFHRDQIHWAVGIQLIVGMWWGITTLLPYAAVVQLLAHVSHRILRRLLTAR